MKEIEPTCEIRSDVCEACFVATPMPSGWTISFGPFSASAPTIEQCAAMLRGVGVEFALPMVPDDWPEQTYKGHSMKLALAAALLLCASTAYAQTPHNPATPVAFETIVTLDSFRIFNRSGSATIVDLWLRPGALETLQFVRSHNDLDVARRPGDATVTHFTFVGGFNRNEWVEFTGDRVDPSTLEVRFAEFWPQGSQFGHVSAELTNGTFRGMTVPEPGAWVMACSLGILGLLAFRSRRH